jgi:hypothetical protein
VVWYVVLRAISHESKTSIHVVIVLWSVLHELEVVLVWPLPKQYVEGTPLPAELTAYNPQYREAVQLWIPLLYHVKTYFTSIGSDLCEDIG